MREEVRRPTTCCTPTTTRSRSRPYASRSPFEVWVVPRRHDADFSRAPRRATSPPPPRRCARCSGRLAASLDGPPYNLVLHSAPLQEKVDATYHWHWEIHPRLREIAGLELGTGLPVNPVSPEDAVEELRSSQEVAPGAGASEAMSGGGGPRPSHARGIAPSHAVGA